MRETGSAIEYTSLCWFKGLLGPVPFNNEVMNVRGAYLLFLVMLLHEFVTVWKPKSVSYPSQLSSSLVSEVQILFINRTV